MLTLIGLELRRVAKPVLRSFVPLALLAAIAVVAPTRGTNQIPQLLVFCIIALATVSVPQQVARDRQSGVLDYFATFPVSGYQLLAVRVIAMAICVACGFLFALTIGLVAGATPFASLSPVNQVTLLMISFAVVLSVGTILISLLARYSLGIVLGVPLAGILVLSTLARFFPLPLETHLSMTALAERPEMLIVAGVLALGTLLLGVLVASAVAARTFQPLPSPASVTGRKLN